MSSIGTIDNQPVPVNLDANISNNAAEMQINGTAQLHGIRGFALQSSNNFSLVAGFGDIAITAIADGGSGTIDVTAAGHSFTAGNVALITGTTNYNNVYIVNSVNGNNFNVIAVFGATETGFTHRPDVFVCNATRQRHFHSAISMSSAVNNQTVEFSLCNGVNLVTSSIIERKFANNDLGALPETASITCTAGDQFFIGVRNNTSTGNLTIKYYTAIIL